MSFKRSMRRLGQAVATPGLLLLLVGYCLYNAENGDRGLRATDIRRRDLAMARANLQQAQADRDSWSRKVASLQSSHLDPDTLDERARAVFNMAGPQDVVVMYPKDKWLY